MRIEVLPLEGPSPAVLPLEIAERKGLGHPDTMCDALAESVSVALSRFYKVMGVRTSDAIHLAVACALVGRSVASLDEYQEKKAAIEVQCCLVSRIGYPIDEPQVADLKVRLDEPQRSDALRAQMVKIVRDQLGEIGSLWRETVEGRIALW